MQNNIAVNINSALNDVENPNFDLKEGFVAIRKQPRSLSNNIGLSVNSSRGEKREFIRENAKNNERDLQLQHGVGLQETNSPEMAAYSSKVFVPTPKDGLFAHLAHLGAYIVRPLDNKQAEDAKDVLKDDYFIIPNIKLDLPETVKTEILGNRRRASVLGLYPEDSGIALAHNNNLRGNNVHVIVLDTGCDADHNQFRGKSLNFRYINPLKTSVRRNVRGFDTAGHGTHVCGIIAGKDVGISPEVTLHVASVIESESYATSLARILSAIDWILSEIVNSAESDDAPIILNMSLGFNPVWVQANGVSVQMQALRSMIQTLVDDFDILTVAASGNSGANNLRAPGYFPEVLSVGAVDFDNQQANFTSTGAIDIDNSGQMRQVPDIWGYGVNVYSALERSADNRSIYGIKSGTSMATPYTTGIAALYAQHTGLIGNQLRQHILQNVSADGIVRFVI